jgi:hypothetical protein
MQAIGSSITSAMWVAQEAELPCGPKIDVFDEAAIPATLRALEDLSHINS